MKPAVSLNYFLILALVLVLVAAGPAGAGGASQADESRQQPQYSHQEYFEHYEGTATCLECHEDAAEAFFHSIHYQWRAEAPNTVNAKGQRLGKMNTLNDFCTNPLPSWIGNVTNEDGKVLAQGCSKCHAGLGERPAETVSRQQLENIDCLICHASGYRRDLFQDEDGSWQWRPILWKNQYGLDSVSKRISLPTRKMCLRCHAGAGGGPNFKRGDIEYTLADCDRSFDVHMGTNGADLQCVDCHAGKDHRIRGRGADLAGTDLPAEPLRCSTADCHGEQPHAARVLNHHTAKIGCTVCHIPEFAKADATDMVRDWSRPKFNEEKKKYTATITFETEVQPVYAWFNGQTRTQLMGQPVQLDENEQVGIMIPEGKRKGKRSRLQAFKLHRGVLPILKDKGWLIPIAVDEFFADGDLDKAVREAAAVVYEIHDPQYEWVETVRYMGIFHEVQPAAAALDCLDCHGPDGRLDWKNLGYRRDPLLQHLRD